jgi:ribulose-5-phosphate 4-epimerase/fuculose-1-phosphate aldolase
MIASLGDKHVLVLRNHGIAVCERDIPSTFALLWTVQRAAEIQCQAAVLGGENTVLSEAVQRRCRDAVADLGSGVRVARLLFEATVRRMRSHDGHPSR